MGHNCTTVLVKKISTSLTASSFPKNQRTLGHLKSKWPWYGPTRAKNFSYEKRKKIVDMLRIGMSRKKYLSLMEYLSALYKASYDAENLNPKFVSKKKWDAISPLFDSFADSGIIILSKNDKLYIDRIIVSICNSEARNQPQMKQEKSLWLFCLWSKLEIMISLLSCFVLIVKHLWAIKVGSRKNQNFSFFCFRKSIKEECSIKYMLDNR